MLVTINGVNQFDTFTWQDVLDLGTWRDVLPYTWYEIYVKSNNILMESPTPEGYDGAIWRTIELTNDVAYKYYAIKCANNHGDGNNIGLRRVVFKKLV